MFDDNDGDDDNDHDDGDDAIAQETDRQTDRIANGISCMFLHTIATMIAYHLVFTLVTVTIDRIPVH